MPLQPKTSVFVGNLSPDVMEEHLQKEFIKYGQIKTVWVARRPPGFAFIKMTNEQDAYNAVKGLDGISLMGYTIKVEIAKSEKKPGRCYNCDSADHIAKNCPKKTHSITSGECFRCGILGHIARDCPTNADLHRVSQRESPRRRSPRRRSPRRRSPRRRSPRRRSPRRRSPHHPIPRDLSPLYYRHPSPRHSDSRMHSSLSLKDHSSQAYYSSRHRSPPRRREYSRSPPRRHEYSRSPPRYRTSLRSASRDRQRNYPLRDSSPARGHTQRDYNQRRYSQRQNSPHGRSSPHGYNVPRGHSPSGYRARSYSPRRGSPRRLTGSSREKIRPQYASRRQNSPRPYYDTNPSRSSPKRSNTFPSQLPPERRNKYSPPPIDDVRNIDVRADPDGYGGYGNGATIHY